jgi:hypothetical protein
MIWNVAVIVDLVDEEVDPKAVARDAFKAIEKSFSHHIEHELVVQVMNDRYEPVAQIIGRPELPVTEPGALLSGPFQHPEYGCPANPEATGDLLRFQALRP